MAKKEKWEVIAHEYSVSLFPIFMLVDGLKIATKVLKDGDLVEVDATKGVVKKIKSYAKIH